MEGHFDQQLCGLCPSLYNSEFYTGGKDKLLIKWDAIKRKMISKKKMEAPVNCIDINKLKVLAVGLQNGVTVLLDSSNLSPIHKITNHKNPDNDIISVVKFSPTGEILAIGYSPPVNEIYLYSVGGKPEKIGTCRGSNSQIVSIDFSKGGDYLLSTSSEAHCYKIPSCQ